MLDFFQNDPNEAHALPAVSAFEAFLQAPSPQSPEAFWQMEKALYQTASQVADQIVWTHLLNVHQDKGFVCQAIQRARAERSVSLVNKGLKPVSILLSGGTRVVLKTPYLRESRRGKRGRQRSKRGQKGTGLYPVLEAIGIQDGVSPATRGEIALYTVQAASYQEAVALLENRGLSCDVSTLRRIATATAQADISLRDAALSTALEMPVAADGPLAGQRVRVSIDGGRVRTRKRKKGRKTKKGRHSFTTPWREPRVLVIDILDEEGHTDPLRLPLYDVLLDDADATFALLIGYLRLLGAAHANVVEFIADGADWIWERIDQLILQAEIPPSILVEVIDFYHASAHLYEAVELCRNLSKKARQKLYRHLRHLLRRDPQGVFKVIEHLQSLATTRRSKKMKKAIGYFEKHAPRMAYADLDEMRLPVGSGHVESAVRRIINLRFKAPGTFWNEENVDGLMHLRACFKAGRWDEMMIRVLCRTFHMPAFEPLKRDKKTSLPGENPCSSLDLDNARRAA